MAVIRVDALCECEGCGKQFGVELEIGTMRIVPAKYFADDDTEFNTMEACNEYEATIPRLKLYREVEALVLADPVFAEQIEKLGVKAREMRIASGGAKRPWRRKVETVASESAIPAMHMPPNDPPEGREDGEGEAGEYTTGYDFGAPEAI